MRTAHPRAIVRLPNRVAARLFIPGLMLVVFGAGCVTRQVYVVDREPAPRVSDAPAPAPYQDPPAVDDVASVDEFYEPLNPYGRWYPHASYGYVFVPSASIVGAGWRPYTRGHWEYTEWGWTWVDHEPFGWATGHYGRWFYDVRLGWVWVPGTRWAPAWVTWRYGGGYVGWAPMPPGAYYGGGYTVYDTSWSFVSYGDLGAPVVTTVIVRGNRYNDCLHVTRWERNTVNVRGDVYYRGPDPDRVRQEGGRVTHRPLREVDNDRPTSQPPSDVVVRRGTRSDGGDHTGRVGRDDRAGRGDRDGRGDRGDGRGDRDDGRGDRGDGRGDRGDGRADRGDGRGEGDPGRGDRGDGRGDRGEAVSDDRREERPDRLGREPTDRAGDRDASLPGEDRGERPDRASRPGDDDDDDVRGHREVGSGRDESGRGSPSVVDVPAESGSGDPGRGAPSVVDVPGRDQADDDRRDDDVTRNTGARAPDPYVDDDDRRGGSDVGRDPGGIRANREEAERPNVEPHLDEDRPTADIPARGPAVPNASRPDDRRGPITPPSSARTPGYAEPPPSRPGPSRAAPPSRSQPSRAAPPPSRPQPSRAAPAPSRSQPSRAAPPSRSQPSRAAPPPSRPAPSRAAPPAKPQPSRSAPPPASSSKSKKKDDDKKRKK